VFFAKDGATGAALAVHAAQAACYRTSYSRGT